jgi:transcriptional regulator with XRE-family HTH domain
MTVAQEIRRLREEKGWSQTKLAAAADMAVSGVSQIETGVRNPSAVTLTKLANALEVEVADLFPKGQAPLPLETTQGGSVPEALSSYLKRRAKSHAAELDDDSSPHFKNATAATLWVASIQSEARDWANWAIEEASVLMPQRDGLLDPDALRDALKVMGHLLSFHHISRQAEKRIAAMTDRPDELAQKRLEKARREAQESEQRLEKWRRAASE